MSSDTPADPLTRLHALGVISAAQRDAALAHPLRHETAADADLVRNLLWLVLRKVMDEDELEAKAAERLVARQYGELHAERKAVLDEAVAGLHLLRQQLNRDTIVLLHTEGLLTEAERDNAAVQAPSDQSFVSAGAALAWMVIGGLLERAQFDALRARVQAERMLDSAGGRVQIIAAAADILDKVHKAHVAAFWRAVLPGSPWLWLAALALVVGGTVWNLATPDRAPSCDSRDMLKSVNGMLFMANLRARSELSLGGRQRPPGAPMVRDAKEVGYASATRQRGCVATLALGEERLPYAYTIAPTKGNEREYTITGAEPAMVEARFSHIDPEGHFVNKAEPVGRDNVERAFRAAVEALHSGVGGASARLLEKMRRPGAPSGNAPEREREIAEIEPLGACREVKAGTHYACRLLVERNDPLLAAIGAGSTTLLKGEFTFERDAGAPAWRMAPVFAEEFMRAVIGGRVEATVSP